MKKYLLAGLLAVGAAFIASPSSAQSGAGNGSRGVSLVPFPATTLTNATTFTNAIALSGQSTCAIGLSGVATGINIVPQISSDFGFSYVPIPNYAPVGGIVATGSYSWPVGSFAPTNFRLAVTSIGTGTLVAVGNCSAAITAGGTTTVATANYTNSGPIAATGGIVSMAITSGQGTCVVGIAGTFVENLVVEQSADGSTFASDNAFGFGYITQPGLYVGTCAGSTFRVRSHDWTSGSATITLIGSTAPIVISPFQNSLGPTSVFSADTFGNAFTAVPAVVPLLAHVGLATSIYVSGYTLNGSATTATAVKLVQGQGTNCGTNQTALTPIYTLVAGGVVPVGANLGQTIATVPPTYDVCFSVAGAGSSGTAAISAVQR